MRTALLTLLAVPLLCVGCGGGDVARTDGAVLDVLGIDGWWSVSMREAGSPNPWLLLSHLELEEDGPYVYMMGREMDRTANTISVAMPNAADPDRVESNWQILTADLIEGLQSSYVAGVVVSESEVRLERIPAPEGIWTMNGTLGGTPVDVYCPSAWGSDETHAAIEYELHVRDFSARSPMSLNLRFLTGAPVAPGDYDVGTAPGQVSLYAEDSNFDRFQASDGTVTIVNLTPTHAEGFYTVTLDAGGSISGIFALDILTHD